MARIASVCPWAELPAGPAPVLPALGPTEADRGGVALLPGPEPALLVRGDLALLLCGNSVSAEGWVFALGGVPGTWTSAVWKNVFSGASPTER